MKLHLHLSGFLLFSCLILVACQQEKDKTEERIEALLSQMTLEEKIGQMVQKNGDTPDLNELIKQGKVGSVINEINPEKIVELQKTSIEKSRLGIPLLIGRDVVHGFRTIMPIPLGQAASWNTNLVEQASHVAAVEATSQGIRWAFCPMVDVTRDPRWGRIAEGFGEDALLNGRFGAAVVRGFQGNNLSHPTSMAACVKHYAGYGWAEGGRDYNSTPIPDNDLFDIILPPFKQCIDAGAASIMTAFNDINGIPATGNIQLIKENLRNNWAFNGVVLTDWESLIQMVTHGYMPDNKQAALQAINASVDMEMASKAYETHLTELIKEGKISVEDIDNSVRRILRLKFQLGLFDNPFPDKNEFPELLNSKHLEISQKLAEESFVLLKNNNILPIKSDVKSITVVGPLADAPHDQLGTWIFDGKKENSITPLQAITQYAKEKGIKLYCHRALDISRSKNIQNKQQLITDARKSDLILAFIGEESILSGESHCLADISLPGAQNELLNILSQTSTPVVGIIMAGRPLTIEPVIPYMDAILYTWHPGTMTGPAILNVLSGKVSPSGKLPVTFPRHVGQIPIYHNHKNTGKPATEKSWVKLDDIPVEAPQLSIGNTSHYLDYGYKPLYPFGFGLSYSSFELSKLIIENQVVNADDTLRFTVDLKNTGNYEASEVVQVYTRQYYGSRARPVKELRDFKKVTLSPGQSTKLVFEITTKNLGFHNPDMIYSVEEGTYQLLIGTSSETTLESEFQIKNN